MAMLFRLARRKAQQCEKASLSYASARGDVLVIHEASRPTILLGQEHRLVHSIDATCGCREDQIAAFEIVNHGAFSTRPGDLHVESRAPALAQLQR